MLELESEYKHLGLSDAQIQELVSRIVPHPGMPHNIVDRVIAALRGEVEPAEYLGLCMTEKDVRDYAESRGIVWTASTEKQKIQNRYGLFMALTKT